MAKYPQEQLEKLLRFLTDDIIHEPANAWFVEKLCKLLPQKEMPHTSHTCNQDIKNIERYLALDFAIDKEYSPCDYSFLDDFLQIKAEADFREMKRFQLGLRGHKKDFAEFCRYVVLQAELMLNFFYEDFYHDNGGIDAAVDIIIQYNSSPSGKRYYDPKQKPERIEDIPFNYKLWAFGKQYGINKATIIIDNARLLRNARSHRSIKVDDADIVMLAHKLKQSGIKVKDDGSLPFLDSTQLYSEDVKAYKFEYFLHKQDFEEVEQALKNLVDKIYDLIKTED